jgi:L-alanine-DL-glutamate epimerase-like enolase superfamily enzyme
MCAVAAVESAVMDAITRQLGIPLWAYFGRKPARLTSDVTIVIADLEETEDAARKFRRQGFNKFKVKIGRDFGLDIQRLKAVRDAAPGCEIYLDANQGYNADETLSMIKELSKLKIKPALIEQPVHKNDWEGLKKVTRCTDVPVCADESVTDLSSAVRAIKEKAVDAINVKLVKFGLFHAREVAALAVASGIDLMIGGMMESALGMMTAAHLAAGLGCFKYVDLDTVFFIKGVYSKTKHISQKGVYDLSGVKAGTGVVFKKP